MPRKYQRRLGARSYKDYPDDSVESALQKIAEEDWSIRREAAEYKIHLAHFVINVLASILREVEVKQFLPLMKKKQAANCCGEWGFPLTITDLRYLAKNYLDSQGRNISNFNSNMPGIDWARSLLERHKGEISQKVAANIK
nr:unnamed protein product [Callosobruchus analis]